MKKAFFLGLMAFTLSGCAFNKVEDNAKHVLIVEAYNVKGCEKLGTTTAKVKNTIGGINVPETQLKAELNNIAKNDAASMGGDSVVVLSPIKGGFQSFAIYKCKN